jgi:hypothetical protein
LRGCDFDAAFRGLAAFAATRLAAAFLAMFADLMDVLLAIAFSLSARDLLHNANDVFVGPLGKDDRVH